MADEEDGQGGLELVLILWQNGILLLGLSADLPEMLGFSPANGWLLRQLFEVYASPEFLEQAVEDFLAQLARELITALPWWHHVELMGKLKDPAARSALDCVQLAAAFGYAACCGE